MLGASGPPVGRRLPSGDELLKTIKERGPDLVISDVRMPNVDGIEAAVTANRERPVPFLIVSAHHDKDTLNRAAAANVVGYLTKPISEADLKTAVTMAMVRFDQFQALLKDNGELRQALEDRDKSKIAGILSVESVPSRVIGMSVRGA